jgi:uncharacterized protein YeeX (DUF496 family)
VIVDKIILHNDQQASIFLQQKLKIATEEQKESMLHTIVEHCCPLMRNRFGNFLIQRCLEYGTPQQVNNIAATMRGRCVSLATNQFSCHVVQKALDCVNDAAKKRMISEMLADINETIAHRYACHVWQKLFELKWGDIYPSFMDVVNEKLAGIWTDIALGETGSLVVQNIFENCTKKDKQPCVDEILDNLDTIIRGQWSNWVVQHMVEYAEQPYRKKVIDFVISGAPAYSVDQFASKAVEKLLKLGDPVVIDAYLESVCQKSLGRPRIPLVDSMFPSGSTVIA